MSEPTMSGAEPTYVAGEEHAGIVMIHDLAGTPQIFHEMSERIAALGFAVDVPLLPGHGTDLEQLDETTWDDWAAAALLALDEMASRTGPIVMCGIGLGATLACFVATQHPTVVGVVAINPRAMPVPQGAIETLEAMFADGVTTVPPLGPDVNDKTAQVVEYQTVPVRTLISMFVALNDLQNVWSEQTSPVLIVTSERDHRVLPYEADWLAERLGGEVKRVKLPNSFHSAPVDVDKELLERAIADFVNELLQP